MSGSVSVCIVGTKDDNSWSSYFYYTTAPRKVDGSLNYDQTCMAISVSWYLWLLLMVGNLIDRIFLGLHILKRRNCPFLEKSECASGAKCQGGRQHSSCAALTSRASCGGKAPSKVPASVATSHWSCQAVEMRPKQLRRWTLYYTKQPHEISNHHISLHRSELEGAEPSPKK